MEDAIYGHRLFGILVEDRVGKPSDQCSPVLVVNLGVHFEHATNFLNTSIDATEELLPQPDATILVPAISLANIELCFWCNNKLSGHIDFGSCV